MPQPRTRGTSLRPCPDTSWVPSWCRHPAGAAPRQASPALLAGLGIVCTFKECFAAWAGAATLPAPRAQSHESELGCAGGAGREKEAAGAGHRAFTGARSLPRIMKPDASAKPRDHRRLPAPSSCSAPRPPSPRGTLRCQTPPPLLTPSPGSHPPLGAVWWPQQGPGCFSPRIPRDRARCVCRRV